MNYRSPGNFYLTVYVMYLHIAVRSETMKLSVWGFWFCLVHCRCSVSWKKWAKIIAVRLCVASWTANHYLSYKNFKAWFLNMSFSWCNLGYHSDLVCSGFRTIYTSLGLKTFVHHWSPNWASRQ